MKIEILVTCCSKCKKAREVLEKVLKNDTVEAEVAKFDFHSY